MGEFSVYTENKGAQISAVFCDAAAPCQQRIVADRVKCLPALVCSQKNSIAALPAAAKPSTIR
jgi:hypothetical protein